MARVEEPKTEIRTDGKKAYSLLARDRHEYLTDRMVQVRNAERARKGYGDRWVPTPDSVDPELVEDRPAPLTGEARRQAFQQGLRHDAELIAATARKGQEDKMSDATATTEAKGTKGSKKEAKTESTRPEWHGHGMCELIRWCGKQGFDKEVTTATLTAVGLEPNPATVNIQLKKGAKDENVPKLSKEDKEELNSHAAKAKAAQKERKAKEAEEKPAKKSKKSADKKASKKAPKVVDEDADTDDEGGAGDDEDADEE